MKMIPTLEPTDKATEGEIRNALLQSLFGEYRRDFSTFDYSLAPWIDKDFIEKNVQEYLSGGVNNNEDIAELRVDFPCPYEIQDRCEDIYKKYCGRLQGMKDEWRKAFLSHKYSDHVIDCPYVYYDGLLQEISDVDKYIATRTKKADKDKLHNQLMAVVAKVKKERDKWEKTIPKKYI